MHTLMTQYSVNLDDAATERPTRIFALYEWGRTLRELHGLDRYDNLAEPARVEIIFPDDTLTVTYSFFNGMFEDSIRLLGDEGFQRRYAFRGYGRIDEVRRRAVDYVLGGPVGIL